MKMVFASVKVEVKIKEKRYQDFLDYTGLENTPELWKAFVQGWDEGYA